MTVISALGAVIKYFKAKSDEVPKHRFSVIELLGIRDVNQLCIVLTTNDTDSTGKVRRSRR